MTCQHGYNYIHRVTHKSVKLGNATLNNSNNNNNNNNNIKPDYSSLVQRSLNPSSHMSLLIKK